MEAHDLAIETQGLRKSYGDVRALGSVDLRVQAGMVFDLLSTARYQRAVGRS